MASLEKKSERSSLSRFTDSLKLSKLKYLVGTFERETTQVWEVNLKRKTIKLDQWHMLPTYRLKLTLFHFDRLCRPGKPIRKTVIIQKGFEGPDTANAAALQLAKACRISGERVMLVSRKEGEIDLLHQYAVGTWDWQNDWGLKVPCR